MSNTYKAELPDLSKKGRRDIEDDLEAWNTFTMDKLVGVHQFEGALVILAGGNRPSLEKLYRKRISRIGQRIIPLASWRDK